MTVVLSVVALSLVATILQRMTGLGFAMLLAPFSVVLLGTHEGVMLTMALAVIASLLILPSMWRDVDWSKVVWLGVPAMLSVPLASWAGTLLNSAVIYLIVGALVILGLSASLVLQRFAPAVDGRGAQVVTGVVSGAGTVLAGIGGPAMTIYGVLARWPVVPFAATLQVLWIMICVVALVFRQLLLGSQIPELPLWGWLACAAGIAVGILIGQWGRTRVNDRVVFAIVVVVAMLGAVLSLVTGLLTLLAD